MVRRPFLLLTVLLLALAAGHPRASRAQEPEPVVIVLVRHAEKAADDPRDPGLTARGVARAEALARTLADVGLTTIWSSDFRRTRSTAGPVAAATGVEMRLYDPSGAQAEGVLAGALLTTPGRHLVVGHSNTIPSLVRALGGDPHGEIAEDEYDRLYVLTVAPGGGVVTTLLRYGPPPGA